MGLNPWPIATNQAVLDELDLAKLAPSRACRPIAAYGAQDLAEKVQVHHRRDRGATSSAAAHVRKGCPSLATNLERPLAISYMKGQEMSSSKFHQPQRHVTNPPEISTKDKSPGKSCSAPFRFSVLYTARNEVRMPLHTCGGSVPKADDICPLDTHIACAILCGPDSPGLSVPET